MVKLRYKFSEAMVDDNYNFSGDANLIVLMKLELASLGPWDGEPMLAMATNLAQAIPGLEILERTMPPSPPENPDEIILY